MMRQNTNQSFDLLESRVDIFDFYVEGQNFHDAYRWFEQNVEPYTDGLDSLDMSRFDGDDRFVKFERTAETFVYPSGTSLLEDKLLKGYDFDGKEYTGYIIATPDTDTFTTYANMDTYCKLFNEAGLGFSDWYAPALGQLALMYLNMTEINAALAKIGGTALAAEYYWSSSEYSSSYAWSVRFSNGYVYSYFNKSSNYRVRFVRDI